MLCSARYQWIQEHGMFCGMDDDTVANLFVKISPNCDDERTREYSGILKTITSCLGFPAADLDRVVESVHEIGEDL